MSACVHRDIKHAKFPSASSALKQWVHTQEAKVALGYASRNSYASFVLSKLLRASYLDECIADV